jgi:sulfane dehydrogenase subunit SoxC
MPMAKDAVRPMSRRSFLVTIGLGGAATLAAACAGPAAAPKPAATSPAATPQTASSPVGVTKAPPSPAAAPSPAASPVAAASPAAAASPSPAAQAPPVVKPVPNTLFNNFGSNHEMRWENMARQDYVVPNELFFIRNHTRTPTIDPATWRLRVEGSGVERPLELSYDELRALPSVTLPRSLECAGNGRSFFETIGGQRAEGTQWKLGAVGVAEWTGVPLREILERAGLKASARDVMPEGLDELKVRRPMSIDKARQDDTLVVHGMNGQPLPPDHGFPARVLIPGWVGSGNVKWVGRIEVSEEPLYSPWNTDSYVLQGPGYEPQPPAKGPILTEQNVKSAIELPWPAELTAGSQTLTGRAWSPVGKIARVECSLDNGATYQEARLRDQNVERAWARWEVTWEATPGTYGIMVRATDERGNTQPDTVQFNTQGYLYNGVVAHPVTVS